MRLLRSSPWLVVTVFLVAAALLGYLSSSIHSEDLYKDSLEFTSRALSKRPGDPPVFAYWISGTGGESGRVLRLLKAAYHPRNRYLLHLDAGSTVYERSKLARGVESVKVFRAFGNVDVMGKGNPVDQEGASAVAAVLHGAAVLMRISKDWDWFIALSASDYPTVTQDELLHIFTPLPRDLNFIDHTSKLGPEENKRFGRIVVDPSLHLRDNAHIFGPEVRRTPDTFKLFGGSPSMILSRPFMEHTLVGWDNLPRRLLMYFSNVADPMETYFQTVICNSPEFMNTTINNDLRYIVRNGTQDLGSLFRNESVDTGAAFAQFKENDPILDKIDTTILRRSSDGVGVGQWCLGLLGNQSENELGSDPCSSWNDINVVKPGPSGKKLRSLVSELVSDERLHSNHCIIHTESID